MGVAVLEQAQPTTVLIRFLGIGRSHADGAVTRVVVGVKQVLNVIYPEHGAAVRQICPSTGREGPIESLNHGRLLFAVTGKMLDPVEFHQGLEVRVKEFLALVGL